MSEIIHFQPFPITYADDAMIFITLPRDGKVEALRKLLINSI